MAADARESGRFLGTRGYFMLLIRQGLLTAIFHSIGPGQRVRPAATTERIAIPQAAHGAGTLPEPVPAVGLGRKLPGGAPFPPARFPSSPLFASARRNRVPGVPGFSTP